MMFLVYTTVQAALSSIQLVYEPPQHFYVWLYISILPLNILATLLDMQKKIFSRFDEIREAAKNYTIKATPEDRSSVLQQVCFLLLRKTSFLTDKACLLCLPFLFDHFLRFLLLLREVRLFSKARSSCMVVKTKVPEIIHLQMMSSMSAAKAKPPLLEHCIKVFLVWFSG